MTAKQVISDNGEMDQNMSHLIFFCAGRMRLSLLFFSLATSLPSLFAYIHAAWNHAEKDVPTLLFWAIVTQLVQFLWQHKIKLLISTFIAATDGSTVAQRKFKSNPFLLISWLIPNIFIGLPSCFTFCLNSALSGRRNAEMKAEMRRTVYPHSRKRWAPLLPKQRDNFTHDEMMDDFLEIVIKNEMRVFQK